MRSSRLQQAGPELEVWGGLECSVVRVGDVVRDQVRETGHYDRVDDLDAIAALGIRVLRYPILWQTVAPDSLETLNWAWHDHRLKRLKELSITPIVGFVHHGAGPEYADFTSELFTQGLSTFAGLVAERYPWLRYFVPVNEPVTTARFSGLYGLWHPHLKEEAAFLRLVVAQCRASAAAMSQIRKTIPDAIFVQTEDLGRVFSTPALASQAAYENERRWLSLDLLAGRVDSGHALRERIRKGGVEDRDVEFFLDTHATPDLLGINHYLTSDRFLDERLGAYPPHTHGGNGKQNYADTEAFRVDLPTAWLGPAARLREAWERFRLPMAVTEVHNGSSPDQQIGWLHEVWNAAVKLRAEGADLRALTVWSLFGAVGWDTLLVGSEGSYESGAFDARTNPPSSTPLGEAIRELIQHRGLPSSAYRGWWQEPERVHYFAA